MARTATIVLDSIKEPDVFGDLIEALKLTEYRRRKFFEFAEYASLELVVDDELNIVSGRFLPVGR